MDLEANKYNKSNGLQMKDAKELIDRIVSENPEEDYDIILDIGCGSGNVTLILDEVFDAKKIVAIDIDEEMIEFAKKHHSRERITYLAQDFSMDWDQLPPVLKSLKGKVSLIFTNHCFHWIQNKECVVKNLHRLLSKTGKIYANICWISDLYMNLSPVEKEIHEKEVMKIPTKEEQFDIWLNLFKNNSFNITSNKFLAKEVIYELNFFEEHVVPLYVSIRKIYFIKKDLDKNQSSDLLVRGLNSNKLSVDDRTGETHVDFKYGFFQFVLKK